MQASDIIKAKQSQVLYRTYANPAGTTSTVISTIKPISSIVRYQSSGVFITSTSYASCLQTVYSYPCGGPRFMTYEMARAAENGSYECGDRIRGQSDWVKNASTFQYAYTPSYSTLSTVSTVRITSTLVATAPAPYITPLGTSYAQGTNFAARCGGCACCPACSG